MSKRDASVLMQSSLGDEEIQPQQPLKKPTKPCLGCEKPCDPEKDFDVVVGIQDGKLVEMHKVEKVVKGLVCLECYNSHEAGFQDCMVERGRGEHQHIGWGVGIGCRLCTSEQEITRCLKEDCPDERAYDKVVAIMEDEGKHEMEEDGSIPYAFWFKESGDPLGDKHPAMRLLLWAWGNEPDSDDEEDLEDEEDEDSEDEEEDDEDYEEE